MKRAIASFITGVMLMSVAPTTFAVGTNGNFVRGSNPRLASRSVLRAMSRATAFLSRAQRRAAYQNLLSRYNRGTQALTVTGSAGRSAARPGIRAIESASRKAYSNRNAPRLRRFTTDSEG